MAGLWQNGVLLISATINHNTQINLYFQYKMYILYTEFYFLEI